MTTSPMTYTSYRLELDSNQLEYLDLRQIAEIERAAAFGDALSMVLGAVRDMFHAVTGPSRAPAWMQKATASADFLNTRPMAEKERAKAFGAYVLHGPNGTGGSGPGRGIAHNDRYVAPAVADLAPVAYLTAADRAQIAHAEAVGAMIAQVWDGVASIFGTRTADEAPASVDMGHANHVSAVREAEAQRARYIGDALAGLAAAAVRRLRGVLPRTAEVADVQNLSERSLADIGFHRVNTQAMSSTNYALFIAQSGAAAVASPANDDTDGASHVA